MNALVGREKRILAPGDHTLLLKQGGERFRRGLRGGGTDHGYRDQRGAHGNGKSHFDPHGITGVGAAVEVAGLSAERSSRSAA